MDLKIIYLLISYIATVIAQDDWEKQCSKCHCLWVSGKKSANCSGRNFFTIPNDLSTEIREVDFSNNFFPSLEPKVFETASIANIHKLKLQNCTIEKVSEWAFTGMGLAIELDLSMNNIVTLNKNVFQPTVRLRTLILSHNKLVKLEDELFYNLTYLQKILLDHNELNVISPNAFQNLPNLIHIALSYNKIQRITFDFKEKIPKLSSLSVENNPWVCDCRLQEFRKSVKLNNLITSGTLCSGPPRLEGRSWLDESAVFACIPEIVDIGPYSVIQATTSNITLTCKVIADPAPDVDWMNNGAIIERDPRKNKQKYITFKDTINGFTWNNLTIININYKDRGEYKCIAKNPAGESERNITIEIPPGALTGGGFVGTLSTNTYLVIGLAIGIIVVLLIVLLILFCFCRKSTHGFYSKRRPHANTSEEYINMSGGHAEIKKSLITDVNPVTKPPRSTVSPSVVSGGTEVSDAKKTLLDNESVFDCDDETRSLDFDQPLLRKSHILLDSANNHYPPDLLPPFPPRAAQISPAGSSASTVADSSRLPPPHGPQSPLQSPIYDQLSLYRTLPYSRSHSPFIGPPVRVPRTGYVTIPRRPRMQSWSSEPPNSSELIAEPLYDNLGVRTTADGATSNLSLDKSDSKSSTPRANRLLPLSATNCDPIAENHEAPPMQPLASQTLPRNLNANNKLTPSKLQWTKANAEVLRSPDKRNSTSSLPPDGQTMKKIPPRPPPKPKKRVSTGPLFEDEGEDGTEV